MAINGIDSGSSPNLAIYWHKSNLSNQNISPLQTQTDDTAVVSKISKEGIEELKASLRETEKKELEAEIEELKTRKFPRQEEKSAVQLEYERICEQEKKRLQELNPFHNIANVVDTAEWDLAQGIEEKLEGKVINPYLVAKELAEMIYIHEGMATREDAAIEERAVKREMALRHSEYIAQNYFTDATEAQSFMDYMKDNIEKAVWWEKGYSFNSHREEGEVLLRPEYTSQYGEFKESDGYREKFFEEYGLEINNDSPDEVKEAYYQAKKKHLARWTEEILNSYQENEKRVEDIINKAKGTVSEAETNESLQRFHSAIAGLAPHANSLVNGSLQTDASAVAELKVANRIKRGDISEPSGTKITDHEVFAKYRKYSRELRESYRKTYNKFEDPEVIYGHGYKFQDDPAIKVPDFFYVDI